MNGHDFTREQNMEARIRLAAARRELADAVNDATTGIGCLTCDDPQTMNHIRACWKRIYDRYLETDSLIADLAACARNITDGGEWKPSELATESKPIDIAEGCACFTAETPDRILIIPSEPTPGENTAKEDSVPDERIEKAAIAIFAAQTNWEEPNPTQKTVKALWDGQMDAVRDSFRRLAKAALDSLEDRQADLDWENAEPKELDNRLVEAVTKGGTIVRGRTVAVQGSLDQLIVEGVLQPLLIRFPGEHWRLANGWKTLNFYKREADSGLHRP